MLDRVPIASLQLAGLALLLLALGWLPGKWRAWGWRLALIKGAVLILGAIMLPWLASEVAPGIPETPFFPKEEVVPSGTLAAPAEVSVNWLLWVWLSGGAFVLTRLVWRATKRIHDLEPLPSEWAVTESSGVPIRLSRSAAAPMIVGIFRPCVVLPAWNTPPAGWEAAVAHEQAHARRRDLLWDALVQGLAALFWFHPAAWLAVREHRLACEEACDAEAIRATGAAPRDYALTLVNLGRPTSAGLALGAPARALRRRIHAMHRHTLSARWALPLLVLAICLAAPIELTAAPLDSQRILASRLDHRSIALLSRPEVRKELGISPGDIKPSKVGMESNSRLRRIGNEVAQMKERGVSIKARVDYENAEKNRLYTEFEQSVLGQLTPTQAQRIREIALQQEGALAMVHPEIARATSLSARTVQTIKQLHQDRVRAYISYQQADFRRRRALIEAGSGLMPQERARLREIRSHGMGPKEFEEMVALESKVRAQPGDPVPETIEAFERRIRSKYNEKALAALSPAERQRWKELQGKPLPLAPAVGHRY